METGFYQGNRKTLLESMKAGSIALFFSGEPLRKTGDEDFAFFAERNFVYLTGIEQKESMLMLTKSPDGACREELFLLPKDAFKERWEGRRLSGEEAQQISGVENFEKYENYLQKVEALLKSGKYHTIYLDIDETRPDNIRILPVQMKEYLKKEYPTTTLENALPFLKNMRLIKKPCEIQAMERAEEITGAGIVAMMTHSKPGMMEYQYKAEYDYALTQAGVLNPGFPSIISAGANNFCIHYYGYRGQAKDGDMVLNDVGAIWEHEITDVSRGWPCNGRYNEKQKLLYQCAYQTSEYMFNTLKPGIPMEEVDKMIRRYNFEQLKAAGVVKNFDDIGTYMWHGGAHHVGFDVHDVVDVKGKLTAPGMVFCVDIGIYHEEWGIGFRLEDNCLITEDGCRNLSAKIPRTIEEIESIMR